MNDLRNTYGDYRIVRVLGQGGMGVVYEAEHAALGRRVALKVLVDDGGGSDPVALARLRREALAMGALQHPHIVQVSDFKEGPPPFLVMELLVGQSLRERLGARGPLSTADACLVAVQLLSALGAAHRAGIVHRDVKPANVFVVSTPLTDVYVKLLDFGVAKLLTPQAGPALTSVNAMVGSAPYMSPEQIRGEEIDGKTDIFAVGVTLYEMIAGRRPFVGGSGPNDSVMLTILRGGPIAPLGALAPPQLEAIILRALQRAPTARYLTADEMAGALMPFVTQGALGAVTTSATTRRESRPEMPLLPAGASSAFATHAETHTQGSPNTVGPPTYAPPTLYDTRDQTAVPPPHAPAWASTRPPVGYAGGSLPSPPMTGGPAPMPYGSMMVPAPFAAIPQLSPTARKWIWVPFAVVGLLIVVGVALRVGFTVMQAQGGLGGTNLGRGALVGSCTSPNASSPVVCTENYKVTGNPLDPKQMCVETFQGTWAERPCSRVGAATGCRSGPIDQWYYGPTAPPPRAACPAPNQILTP